MLTIIDLIVLAGGSKSMLATSGAFSVLIDACMTADASGDELVAVTVTAEASIPLARRATH